MYNAIVNVNYQKQLWQQQLLLKQQNSVDKSKRNSSNIYLDQLNIIQTLPTCHVDTTFANQVNKIEPLLIDQFYKIDLINTIVNSSPLVATLSGSLDSIIKVYQWFTTLKTDNNFIVKNVTKNNINHLFVALFGTNHLRKFVPNFAYIYSGVQCCNPIIDCIDNKPLNCLYNQPSYYLIYENFGSSPTLLSQSKSMTFDYFLLYYLQILLALRKALEICNFTHYNLDGDNILLYQLPTLAAIEYDSFYGKRYIHTNKIAMIINYDYSFISYNNKTYTDIDQANSQNRAFILGDAHKLLCNIMYNNFNSNKSLFINCIKILKFFTPISDVIDSVNYLNSIRYSAFQLLPTAELDKVGVDDLIDYILKLNNNILHTTIQTKNVISCDNNNICLSNDDVITNINSLPMSIESFYDRLSLYNKDN